MPPRTFPVNPRLEIFTDEGQPKGQNEQLHPTSTRYQELERCIQMSLIVLESQAGRNSLVNTAKSIITNRRNDNKPTLYTGNFSDLPRWIEVFLRCMRDDFPMTYLAHIKGEAVAVRQANEMRTMGSFSPKHMGYMDVNRYIVNNMISARTRNDTHTETLFRFQLVISIAHEIVHFLTGFFTGEKADKIGTPPETSVEGYGTLRRGEAGRFWEEELLGGQLEMWQDKASQLGVIQAGQPYLMDDGDKKSRARVVNYGYIEQFIAGRQMFPIRTDGTRGVTTRAALRAKTEEMTDVRWRKARSAPGAESPPPRPGASNRRTPSSSTKPVRTAMKGIYSTRVPS